MKCASSPELGYTVGQKQRNGPIANLLDRLDQNEQLMTVQLDATRAMNKAIRPLYASFSDTQQKSADQLFWGPMGMM